MGWLRFDDHPDADRHEGFVQLLVREAESAYWLPVASCQALEFGRREIESEELVFGLYSADRRFKVRQYRIQVQCECGWAGPLMTVPFGAKWWPVSIQLDERDDTAAGDLWGRLHRDRLDEWPSSLAQFWPKAAL